MNLTLNVLSPHVFSVSGPRGSGRTSLYQELEPLFAENFPGHTFAFLGNPFGGTIPHPLLLNRGEWHLRPYPAVFKGWFRLAEFCEKKLCPALAAGHSVVTDGFGLDIYLNAMASCLSAEERKQTAKLHHSIVRTLMDAGIITPPHYIIPSAPEPGAVCAHLKRDDLPNVVEFVRNESETLQQYFDGTGQRDPLYLPENLIGCDRARAILDYVTPIILRKAA